MSNFEDKDRQIELIRARQAERPKVTGPTRSVVIFLQKSIWLLSRRWPAAANLLLGIILALGFLAPLLMAADLPAAGQVVYDILAPHNHQLPQRSYFLFGQTGGLQTYSLDQIIAAGADPADLQAFVGDAAMGFKMALNHRMTAIFVGLFLGGLVWSLAGRRPEIKPLWFILFLLPVLIDGFSHMIGQNSGLGFRESNTWAVGLTGGAFPPSFYEGTTLGTLNWLLRTVTGLLFGLGCVWFLYTYLSTRFQAIRLRLEPKLKKVGALENDEIE